MKITVKLCTSWTWKKNHFEILIYQKLNSTQKNNFPLEGDLQKKNVGSLLEFNAALHTSKLYSRQTLSMPTFASGGQRSSCVSNTIMTRKYPVTGLNNPIFAASIFNPLLRCYNLYPWQKRWERYCFTTFEDQFFS